jgi:hypothetical protein
MFGVNLATRVPPPWSVLDDSGLNSHRGFEV